MKTQPNTAIHCKKTQPNTVSRCKKTQPDTATHCKKTQPTCVYILLCSTLISKQTDNLCEYRLKE